MQMPHTHTHRKIWPNSHFISDAKWWISFCASPSATHRPYIIFFNLIFFALLYFSRPRATTWCSQMKMILKVKNVNLFQRIWLHCVPWMAWGASEPNFFRIFFSTLLLFALILLLPLNEWAFTVNGLVQLGFFFVNSSSTGTRRERGMERELFRCHRRYFRRRYLCRMETTCSQHNGAHEKYTQFVKFRLCVRRNLSAGAHTTVPLSYSAAALLTSYGWFWLAPHVEGEREKEII